MVNRSHTLEETLCPADAHRATTSKVRAWARRGFIQFRESDGLRLASFAQSDGPSNLSREAVPFELV